MSLFTKLGNDIASPVDASGAPRPVENGDMQRWMTEVERILAVFQAGGGIVFPDLATANASLAYNANQMAWVMGDPTPANNGVYRKVGASGSGSWVRMGDLQFSMIPLSNAGAGTADAIVATSSLPLPTTPGAALLTVNILADNTGNVTLNGKPLRTNSGNEIATGGLTAGSIPAFLDLGDHFRLLSDQAGAAIVAAAEAAQLAAEAARDQAEAIVGFDGTATTVGYDGAASGLAADNAQEAIDELAADGGMSSAWAISGYHPVSAPNSIRTAGYYAAGDSGGALYKKVVTEPSHAGKISITLADGVTEVWYEIAESILTERMFGVHCDGDWDGGGTDDTTLLQAWAECPTSNIKRFTGVSKATGTITFPIDTILDGLGDECGVDFSAAVSLSSGACVFFDGSANLVQIADLDGNMSMGSVAFDLMDASAVEPADYLCIYNPTDHSWTAGNVAGSRSTYRAGEWVRVQSVSGDTVTIYGPTWAGYVAADVDVYRLRGGGPKIKNFRVKPPYIECAAILIDCAVAPVVENINRTDGSEYAGIVLQRCMDPYVNCNNAQLPDAGTPGNEYALIFSTCHGGEVHGSYYAQRHGFAQGNADYVCCVPNRETRVYANTKNSFPVGSLDFGHGCSQGLVAIGGTHSGVAIGGKDHTVIGCRIRKGAVVGSGSPGNAIHSSEIYGGTHSFIGCHIEESVPTGGGIGAVDFVVQAAAVEPIVLSFKDCVFQIANGDFWVIRVQASNSAVGISVEVENPLIIGGAALTQFLRMQNVAGTFTCPLLVCRGVKGLGSTVPPVALSGVVTFSGGVLMDAQRGQVLVAGNTGAASVTQSVSYPWPYPTGVTPWIRAQQISASVGGKRSLAWGASIGNASFTLTVASCDAANFANTNAGTVQWEATVG